MKHCLVIMKPPYATGIITQHDGSLMLKFERVRKAGMIEMLEKAVQEIMDMPDADPSEEFKVIDLNQPTKVVPAVGPLPPMQMQKIRTPSLKTRDELPTDFRKIGRRVTVEENNITYELQGGIENHNWREVEIQTAS